MSGILYLCATPIGNLEDMTYRAVRMLEEADLIAAEDTRNSIKLLNHFDIHTPMTSYHEHNRFEKGPVLVEKLKNYNAYTTVVNICNPLIYKIFGINSYHISLDNNCLINLYCYDFLKDHDPDKTELLRLLTSASVISKDRTAIPDEIKLFAQSTIVSKELGKAYKFLNHANLKKIITESISVLYQYKYVDVETNEEIEVNWYKFIEEFIEYLRKIASEDYTEFIQKEQERMYTTNVNVNQEMV